MDGKDENNADAPWKEHGYDSFASMKEAMDKMEQRFKDRDTTVGRQGAEMGELRKERDELREQFTGVNNTLSEMQKKMDEMAGGQQQQQGGEQQQAGQQQAKEEKTDWDEEERKISVKLSPEQRKAVVDGYEKATPEMKKLLDTAEGRVALLTQLHGEGSTQEGQAAHASPFKHLIPKETAPTVEEQVAAQLKLLRNGGSKIPPTGSSKAGTSAPTGGGQAGGTPSGSETQGKGSWNGSLMGRKS